MYYGLILDQMLVLFLNQLQRGVHRWFSEQGFSIGIGDFIATKETKEKIENEYQLTLKASTLKKKVK